MSSTRMIKSGAGRRMGLLFAALAMVGFLTAKTANGQTVYEGTLHSFSNTGGDGAYPSAALIMDTQGNFFGTAGGGTYGSGIVFELVNNSGTFSEKILYSFSGYADGQGPNSLIMDSQGNLFGTTSGYGVNGYGTVFELVNNSGTYSEQTLYSFAATAGDGQGPNSLIMDSQGNLFGTTVGGGAKGFGIVFELVKSSSYSEQILYSFSGTDGSDPGSLIIDSQGNLFGITGFGGSTFNSTSFPNGIGTVFELVNNNSGSYSGQTLHNFTGTGGDGQGPTALTMDGQGNLYGTADAGGLGYGMVFELVKGSSSFTLQILHNFSGTTGDAQYPLSLIVDSHGNLLGTTAFGGANGDGAVFDMVNNSGVWSEQVLYSPRPGVPLSPLLENASGVIYGTTTGNNTTNFGTVFELAILPSGASPFSTITSLTCSPSNLNADAPATTIQCAAKLTSSAPQGLVLEDGSISFYYGTTVLGTSPVSNATATLSFNSSALAVGTNTITAQYTPASPVFVASSGQVLITLSEPGVAITNGNNTFNGNQAVNGTVSATAFTGNGSGLTGVLASGLAPGATIAGSQVIGAVASATNAGSAATATTLTGNISDTQVTNLTADLASASTSAVATADAYAKSTFLPLAGGTLTGPLNGTSASLTGAFAGASAKFSGSVAIGGGTAITEYISVTQNVASLPALNPGACTTLTTAPLSGFTPGTSDTIALGLPSSLTNLGTGIFLLYQAWETGTGASPTITIQVCNPSAKYKGGASGAIRIDIFKH